MIRRVDRGEADWGHTIAGVFMDPALGLVARHGVNRSRFFIKPGLTLRMLAFNSSRPLFRDNPRLRKAINYALDRKLLQATSGGPMVTRLTDQHLPQTLPGFRDGNVYPLTAPDLDRAKALADTSRRSGKAVMYTSTFPLAVQLAQLVKQQLAEIGVEIEVRTIPIHIATAAYLTKLASRGEPWDLALVLWTPNLADPHAYINLLLETQFVGGTTLTRFRSEPYLREIRRVARELQSTRRLSAYGALDIRLAREAAPVAPIDVVGEATLVSERVGCMTLRPVLDLTTVCLRE